VPITIKPVFSEWTVNTIHLIITFAVNILEWLNIRFSFLCFKHKRICLEIGFVVSCYISMMFKFVWTIAFLTLKFICATCKCGILLLCQVQFTPEWKSAGWTQRWVDLWNNLGFSLCAVLSVCHVVATSDDGKKSEMRMSVDWCVTVEHWRLSSIRVIFINYQTSELQYNY